MSSKCASPTANLLRQSRIFSLPPPLPRPASESSITRIGSPFSTTPYPSHAAITTPESSRSRGDWGLKRNLPLKTTATTSTPTINVQEIDSIYHITEYTSAADHTVNLQKWQAMHVPLSPRPLRESYSAIQPVKVDEDAKSVFESTSDITAPGFDRVPGLTRRRRSQAQRWKFRGPWLVGKTENDFNTYLEKEIAGKRQDFNNFLRGKAAEDLQGKKRRDVMEEGAVSEAKAPSISAEDVSEQDLSRFTQRLRNNKPMMDQLITDFLDLPASEDQSGASSSLFARNGPPLTHPSAGLSYLRSSARIRNHPVHGPQAELAMPLEARVLQPRQINGRPNAYTAKLGVAGFVADDSITNQGQSVRSRAQETPGVRTFDPTTPGGPKVWVNPKSAFIDATGHVILGIARTSSLDVEIAKKGQYDGPPVNTLHFTSPTTPSSVPEAQSTSSGRNGNESGNPTYPPRPEIKPFNNISSGGSLEELRRIVDRENK
jgi:hypothetical protein